MKTPILRAALKSLKSRLPSPDSRWIFVIVQYVLWNIINYVYGKHNDDYYKVYYINMALFIMLCFWSLAGLLPSQYKKYKWVLNVLTCIATFKLVYTILIVANLVSESDTVVIVAMVFILTIGIITLKWPTR